ncbi:hypothetical protein SNEBB_001591 [Seison nebaliae]|nr:hypothetical protein SNEBB_001591 [Seison nebaliae]
MTENDNASNNLRRTITLFNAISIIVGSVIGSGIFVNVKGVLTTTGSIGMAMVVWVLCGFYSFCGCFSYGELGVGIPKSGGDYAYIMDYFGKFCGFLKLYVDCFIVRGTTITINALTFAYYSIAPFYGDCVNIPKPAIKLIAICLILFLVSINIVGTRHSLRLQNVTMVMKVFALILFIGLGILQFYQGKIDNYRTMWLGTSYSITGFGMACYHALFSYNSWNYLNTVAEEVINPKRNIPLAIMMSITIIVSCYLLTLCSYFTVISLDEALVSNAIGVTYVQKIYQPLVYVMPIFVLFSTMGSCNGQIFNLSRLFFVGAREEQMPTVLTMLHNKKNTPIVAFVMAGVIGIFFVMFPSIELLVECAGLATWGPIAVTVGISIYLRRKHPEGIGEFKPPIILSYIYVILSILIFGLAAIYNKRNFFIAIILILSGVPFYLIFLNPGIGKKSFSSVMNNITVKCQKMFSLDPPPDHKSK